MRLAAEGFGMRAAGLGLALALSACQTEPMGGPLKLEVEARSPTAALQTISEHGRKCWIAADGQRLRGLSMVPELDTTAGTPRILIVRSGKSEGLPALVIEAAGDPVTVETYGPLAASAAGARINRDIMRWSAEQSAC